MSEAPQYVVVAFNPVVDASAVVGPFASKEGAMVASDDLAAQGYNTEICRLSKVEDVLASGPCGRSE